jgi:hypothetical protein
MPNPFIELYKREQLLGKEYVFAIDAALEKLKQAWQT